MLREFQNGGILITAWGIRVGKPDQEGTMFTYLAIIAAIWLVFGFDAGRIAQEKEKPKTEQVESQ